MLLKLIGSMLVIGASSFIGYVLSRECSRRPVQLRSLQGMLQMLENEISFLSNLLTDALERIYKSSNNEVSCIFKAALDNLSHDDGFNASEAWEKAVRENIKQTALNKEDEQILVSFGKMLGSSDLDGQLKNIKLTVNQLKLQEQKAEEYKRKNEAMYKTLGVLGGIAVVIILI